MPVPLPNRFWQQGISHIAGQTSYISFGFLHTVIFSTLPIQCRNAPCLRQPFPSDSENRRFCKNHTVLFFLSKVTKPPKQSCAHAVTVRLRYISARFGRFPPASAYGTPLYLRYFFLHEPGNPLKNFVSPAVPAIPTAQSESDWTLP